MVGEMTDRVLLLRRYKMSENYYFFYSRMCIFEDICTRAEGEESNAHKKLLELKKERISQVVC